MNLSGKRSYIMSRIKSSNTKPEIILKNALYSKGLRGYQLNYAKLQGKPDIVFIRHKVAIFVDGDFWHGYNWKQLGKVPPITYWQAKISSNIRRDKLVTKSLRSRGWTVIRFWEHDVNQNVNKCVKRIYYSIFSPSSPSPRAPLGTFSARA